ncbi:hypothetical protein [Methylobacterium marchantiae]|uniref:Uncharacterized protein n=1 Tax=Methylobacterium marchantiae TaxID=600331 RepID=A0ABW3WWV7_9HYPH|nr:hypothetical protein AIGOOFII_3439 [Methylobacterium marchantiae]
MDQSFEIVCLLEDTASQAFGLALPGTALAQQLFSVCMANGGGGQDHLGLVCDLEVMGHHEIATS